MDERATQEKYYKTLIEHAVEIVEIICVQFWLLDFGFLPLPGLQVYPPCAGHFQVKGKILLCLRYLVDDGAHVY